VTHTQSTEREKKGGKGSQKTVRKKWTSCREIPWPEPFFTACPGMHELTSTSEWFRVAVSVD